MKSTHLPEVAYGLETFTGSLIVDTGLRLCRAFVATLGKDSSATVAQVTFEPIAQLPGETFRVTLKTWEDDLVTAGSTSAVVSWIAIGD